MTAGASSKLIRVTVETLGYELNLSEIFNPLSGSLEAMTIPTLGLRSCHFSIPTASLPLIILWHLSNNAIEIVQAHFWP
jgi:hypothetical protein